MFAEINKDAMSALPFAINTIGESKKQPDMIRPAGFNYHHLIWVTRGSGIFETGGKTFVLGSGEGIFMRKGVPHSYRGDDYSTMWFTFAMNSSTLDFIGVGDYLVFRAPDNLCSEAMQLMAFANGNSNILSRSGAGYTFITEFFSKVLSDKVSISDKVLDILERKYSVPLSLDDIADELGTDKYSLCRIFKSEKNTTVINELFKIRISKAKKFLKISNDSIHEIGLMCGFENSCYFIKRFKEAVGCTPSQYRKRN